jgi:hypothetical protein
MTHDLRTYLPLPLFPVFSSFVTADYVLFLSLLSLPMLCSYLILYSIYTGLVISPLHFLKIRNKQTTQRIIVILTPIERETLQGFLNNFKDAQCVRLW